MQRRAVVNCATPDGKEALRDLIDGSASVAMGFRTTDHAAQFAAEERGDDAVPL